MRSAPVAQYAAEARENVQGGAEGVLFDSAPDSVLEAADGLRAPAPLADAGLTSPVLSLGNSGSGLPFHNHGAAWLTVLAGKKLVVLLPPNPEGEERPQPGWQTLQHAPPASWAGADPVTSGSKLGEAGLSTNPTVRAQRFISWLAKDAMKAGSDRGRDRGRAVFRANFTPAAHDPAF